MRKYIIGMLVGFVLAFSLSAHAEDIKTAIGKVIQGEFPVKINGKQLDKNAIVIEGSSYLPVRVMGDALGLDVSFNADLGIELKKKETEATTKEGKSVHSNATATTDEWLQEKIKNAPSYKVKSKSLPIKKPEDARFKYLNLDGEFYMELTALNGEYVRWISPNFVLSLPDSQPIIVYVPIGKAYSTGINSFRQDGIAYINYSSIGLITTLIGDTVWIEKAE